LLCCSTDRQTRPTSLPMPPPEEKERYVVHLVCPNRTLGLELAYSKRAPFIVTPMNMPATGTQIRKGDALVGIGDNFFNRWTRFDKVLNQVRKRMESTQPVIKLILERNNTPPKIIETDVESVDEKLAELPETKGQLPTPPPTEIPETKRRLPTPPPTEIHETLKDSPEQQVDKAVVENNAIHANEIKEMAK